MSTKIWHLLIKITQKTNFSFTIRRPESTFCISNFPRDIKRPTHPTQLPRPAEALRANLYNFHNYSSSLFNRSTPIVSTSIQIHGEYVFREAVSPVVAYCSLRRRGEGIEFIGGHLGRRAFLIMSGFDDEEGHRISASSLIHFGIMLYLVWGVLGQKAQFSFVKICGKLCFYPSEIMCRNVYSQNIIYLNID